MTLIAVVMITLFPPPIISDAENVGAGVGANVDGSKNPRSPLHCELQEKLKQGPMIASLHEKAKPTLDPKGQAKHLQSTGNGSVCSSPNKFVSHRQRPC